MRDVADRRIQKGNMRNIFIKCFMLALGSTIIVSFVVYCVLYRENLSILLAIEPFVFFPIITLTLIHRGVLALRFKTLCRPYGVVVPFWDSYLLTCVSGAINMIFPIRGGFAARALYLKKRHGLFYSYLPSLILSSTILSFIVGGILIILTNFIWFFKGYSTTWVLWVFGLALCSSVIIFLINPPRFLQNFSGEVGKKVNMSFDGWKLIRSDIRSLTIVCSLHFLIILVSSIIIYISFYAVNLDVTVPVAVSMSVFNSFIGVVNLTPANFGIQEWSTAFIGSLTDLNFHSGVAAALIMRAAGVVVNLTGGAIGYYTLFIKRTFN